MRPKLERSPDGDQLESIDLHFFQTAQANTWAGQVSNPANDHTSDGQDQTWKAYNLGLLTEKHQLPRFSEMI